MADKKDEVIVDVEEVYSKTESYIEENKNSLTIIVAAIIVIVGGYFGYQKMYVAPMESEAKEQMWKAEQYFEEGKYDLAINGDGNYFGFLDVIDNYGVTDAANLANYYVGISYLRLGEYETAIDFLSSFDANDKIVGPIATGAIGDAYMELGNVDEALSFYMKAAEKSPNDFTTPIYLMKAGLAYEAIEDYGKAKQVYEQIKENYPTSNEGRNIDKHLAKVETLAG